MIEFLCPNGHRIRCPAEQAGRAAKCPRCGVKFRVPDAADLAPSDVIGSDSGISPAEFTDSGISDKKPPSSIGRAEREPPIEFLCPNGHRLFGAASLQGKAGKCPECGSRFRIPMREETTADDASNPPGQSAPASLRRRCQSRARGFRRAARNGSGMPCRRRAESPKSIFATERSFRPSGSSETFPGRATPCSSCASPTAR